MNPKKFLCFRQEQNVTDDPFNPLNRMFIQMAIILVMSHFFYLVLKPLGQTGPVAQILAGIMMSPAVLSRFSKIREYLISQSSANYYSFFSFIFRTFFMFLIGLEIDSDFLRRNFRRAAVITCGGFAGCSILGLLFIWLIIYLLQIETNFVTFILTFLITLSNTASPVVFQSITDMKLHTSEIGRLAISCSLLMEMFSIVIYIMVIPVAMVTGIHIIFSLVILTGILIFLNKNLAPWFSMRCPNEKYLSKTQTLVFFLLVLIFSTIIESSDLNSALPVFLIGLAFPREGKSYRTLLQRLIYPVHEFIFPIYFGYIGFRLSSMSLDVKQYIVLVLTVILSIGGKVIGVFGACYYQRIPRKHWLFLSSILSMKGHAALLLLDLDRNSKLWLDDSLRELLVSAIVITTLLTGVLASFLLRSQERDFAHHKTSIEFHDTDKELRILSCVYGLRHARGAISLVSALSNSEISSSSSHFAPLLIHLVPLPRKRNANLLYHEKEDPGKFVEDDESLTNEGLEINDSVDSFAKESKILIHQMKLVSQMLNMHEEVCNAAEDLRVSIIVLPFHKHQRIDGKTSNDGEELRTTNQKILRHAPCSVGIFVDRSQTGFQQPHGFESVQHVAALFFGGPDDREALALCKWLANNSLLQLTIIRFMAENNSKEENPIGRASHENDDVFMEIHDGETENQLDCSFLEDFYNRFVTTGQVGYLEKHVRNGAQTLTILREIGEMYSLFVVGKGRGDSPMTTGMNDWEECPELGTVGDLLASSDIVINASVLIVQRHKPSHDSPLDAY